MSRLRGFVWGIQASERISIASGSARQPKPRLLPGWCAGSLVRSLAWIPLTISLVVFASTAESQISKQEYADRRTAVAERMSTSFLVLPGGEEPAFDYMDFGQDPNFFYLTGIDEAGAALVIVKDGSKVTSTLFVQPRDPAREVWSGYRLGAAGARERTGLPSREMAGFDAYVDSLVAALPAAYVSRGQRGLAERLREKMPDLTVLPVDGILRSLRRTKSAAELDLLRKAIAITVDAQVAAMRAIAPGMNEFEVEALIEYTFRRNGADRPGFNSIVGSGPNSTTLHYNRNDRFMLDGEMVVMDVGASYRGYTADVTRSVPVNGVFSEAQRAIYQVVRDAQASGERAAQLGAPNTAMIIAVDSVIRNGLTSLGLIEAPDALYDCEGGQKCPQYRLYYMHGLGHAIGLQVHDPGTSGIEAGVLRPGDAFSIEPGIYVRANLLDIIPVTPANDAMKSRIAGAVRRYSNIGVRIEDDYIVTADGVEWASRAPREIHEIEATMRDRAPPPRDAAKVEWYRATAPRAPVAP